MRTAKMAKLWAVIAAGSVAVAACSSSASPSAASPAGSAAASAQASASAPAEKVTINFPYLWGGPEGQALEKVITAFNTSQDHITVKGVSSPDFQKQLASMSGSNGFDISDNFGSTVGSWASKGILEPLDDYMKADNFDTADFVPTALQSNQYQGKTYALPIAVHTLLLMYNKKMFSDAGIAAPPTTMSDLQADIAKLTKADSSGKITQLGMRSPDYITLAYAFGGKWYDDQGNPTPDDPGNLAALHFWVDNVVKKYGADPIKKFESGYGEYASAQNPFYTGKVAMTLDGEWQPVFIKQYAPNLDWGVVAIPYPANQATLAGATQLTSSMFFIPKNAPHKQEAWTFLKYLTGKDAMTQFSHALGNLPARTSLLGDPTYNDIPQFNTWLDSLKSPNLRIFASLPSTAAYQKDLGDEFQLIANLQDTPEVGMAKVKAKAAGYSQ
ncbi:MAG: ABC transporter substrate-binding protein [Chloroflexi bacterium]|nr:MAG: ABC transporter substrate-binding protein [Chloroflexota bacterium]